ncbi:MAG: hypothetical protein KJO55_06900 [Gammaproteobacteria bacterium]|nr:hypothetical protein [Gammaproteobacteria bacterium]
MLYLIQQIVLCLVLTALIGIAVGWLLRGVGTSRQTDLVEARWRAKLAQVEENQSASIDQLTPTPGPAAEAELDELRKRLEVSERELATLRTAQAVRKHTDEPGSAVHQDLKETRIICQQLQGQLAQQKSDQAQIEKRLEQAIGQRQELVERLRDLETRNAEVNQDRQHALDTVTELQKEIRSLHSSAVAAAKPAAAPPTPETDPDSTLTETARAGATGAAAAIEAATARQQRLPIGGDATPRKIYEPDWRLSAPDGEPDKLQSIYGIGPKIEQQLNQLGVFHFRQIAAFTTTDVAWVEMHLRSFPGRILRDRWVEQARTLESRQR